MGKVVRPEVRILRGHGAFGKRKGSHLKQELANLSCEGPTVLGF